MTREQREELKAQLEAEEKKEAARIEAEREAYKQLVDTTVEKCVKKLQMLSSEMMRLKQEVFQEFDAVVKMKDELFKVKIDRKSNTFTTSDGRMTLTLGSRTNEGWDDSVEAGIAKVKEYLGTLAKDENSAVLVETVMGLLAKDRKGTLKANKVLELERLAVKTQDKEFLDGISIIKNAYRPVPTCQYISVETKDDKGNAVSLPLSLSAM